MSRFDNKDGGLRRIDIFSTTIYFLEGRNGSSLLAQEGLDGGCLTERGGQKVLAVRKRHRSTTSGPDEKQTRLDSYLEPAPLSEDMFGSGVCTEQEWQRTISTLLRHDLLNKLMVAKGGLEMFDRSGDEKYLAMTRRNIDTCGEIIARISTLENAPGPAKLALTDVASVARKVMSIHQEQGLVLDVQGEAWAMADASLFHVLDNLVSNAIKHASPSMVRIDIEEKGIQVSVRVTDDGIGIPQEARARLFQEGFKFGPKGNTGLGLFIVRRLVERCGGKIWLEENVPNKTVFCIELKTVEE